MFSLFGIDEKAIANAVKRLPELENTIEKNMDCIKENLIAMRRSLASEYGAAVEGFEGYDPRKRPEIISLSAASGEVKETDIKGVVGKLVSRGHIKVLSSSTGSAKLRFGNRKTIDSTQIDWTNPYPLEAGEVLDISFFLEMLEVTGVSGSVDLVVFAQ